ncbi:MAG: peptidoglycan DD-metalloendopeptidase family protein [Bacillaceae bacterium]
MSRRAEDIRKRIAKRNEQKRYYSFDTDMQHYQYEHIELDTKQKAKVNIHGQLVKILFSIALVLAIAVIYRGEASGQKQTLRNAVSSLFNQDFQFAAVNNWLEMNFGQSLTFINDEKNKNGSSELAVPANGRVLQGFQEDGQGVMVEVDPNAKVGAIKEGKVIYIGNKPNVNNTVVIQHDDNTESWYGNLEGISVKLYDQVKVRQVVGHAKEESGKGQFYFALKKNEKFIDPIQVIPFVE